MLMWVPQNAITPILLYIKKPSLPFPSYPPILLELIQESDFSKLVFMPSRPTPIS